jgi:hypothetical protein
VSEGRCLVGGATSAPCDTGPGRCMDDQTQADFCDGASCRYCILQTMRVSQQQVHYSIRCARVPEVNKFL